MMIKRVTILAAAVMMMGWATLASADGDRVRTDDRGRIVPVPLPTPERLINPWPAEWEDALIDRANQSIAHHSGGNYGNKFFENEKSSYPRAMLDFLAGNRQRAIAFLQAEDVNRDWHTHTEGIDFFPSFTLKGQMRKYFFFGQYLDEEYRNRMRRGATTWTERDPLRRPHHAFRNAQGWTPEARNSWVDIRGTDNLRMMRDTSIYLMAEETGNERTRRVALDRLQYEVSAMFNIGMGEWDSENYLGHSFAPWLNLYDFARDEEVRMLAKAALDWMSAAAAVKYWRSGWNGPTKRDYYHPAAWRTPAASDFGFYFADAPQPDPTPSLEHIHMMTSAYRPPRAVVAMARKKFERPVELLLSHPPYGHYSGQRSADRPEFHETQYIANTFMLGSLPTGNIGDTNGFKMLTYNQERGVDFFMAATGNRPDRIVTSTNNRDRVAQYRNLIIFLNGDAEADFHFWVPNSMDVERERGVIFLRFERTWAALKPINLDWRGNNPQATERIRQQRYEAEQILAAKGTGGRFSGFAMIVGEAESHGSYEAFKRAAHAARLDLRALANGEARLDAGDCGSVGIRFGEGNLPTVWRNGQQHDWDDHFAQYQPVGGDKPIKQGWKTGRFRVEAGGWVFQGRLDADGRYTFEERSAD
ncbi:MAG: hypothetical protein JJU36_09085 [Phycisphaeraceae bacterium]|nr:hypothetical protein [Phycisphaeraceae bacterium]